MKSLQGSALLRLALVVALAATLPACAWLLGSWGGSAPERNVRDNIKFSHNWHVAAAEDPDCLPNAKGDTGACQGLACADCHDGIASSEDLSKKREIPTETKCMDCHDKAEGGCDKCHANPAMPTTFVDTRRTFDVNFSHKNHLGRVQKAGDKDTCVRCHGDIRKHAKVSDDMRPNMLVACTSCHSRDFRTENCYTCHKGLKATPDKPVRDFDHGADWLRRHGVVAKGQSKVCGHCHQETSCAECHSKNNAIRPDLLHADRVDASFHHRGDYMSRHAMEAKLDSKGCQTCHAPQTCAKCHERMGLSQPTAGGGPSPHPAGWMDRGGVDNHGRAARQDITACAACHDRGAASNCVKCHKVGEPGGNPHPPGWSSKQDSKTAPACTPCHI